MWFVTMWRLMWGVLMDLPQCNCNSNQGRWPCKCKERKR
jgi:hypothetical protein